MTKFTLFTHVKFITIIQTNEAENVLDKLMEAGYKELAETVSVGIDVLTVCRDILFAEKDIQTEEEWIKRETERTQHLLSHFQCNGKWLATFIHSTGRYHIPNNQVDYNGRTVCMEASPDLMNYVE